MFKRAWGFGFGVAATLTLVPSLVLADQVAPFSGTASTAALTVSVSPTALVAVPSNVVNQQLPASVRNLLTTALQPLTVQVDTAHASATRAGTAKDISTGHADVTPLSLDLSRLGTLLGELHSGFSDLAQGVVVPAASSAQEQVNTITGNATVMGLLPSALATELTALGQQLSSLTTAETALATDITKSVDDLSATLNNQLSQALAITDGLIADLDSSHPNGQSTTQPAITVPQPVTLPADVPTLPVAASLSPFTATAVNAVGARQFGASGPQATADESASGIGITPSLDLSTLQNDVSSLRATLQQVSTSIATINPQLGAVAAIIAQALPSGLSLATLQTQVTAVAPQATVLFQLVSGLQLNQLLLCNALGTSACSLASAAVTPQGAGLHAVASGKLVDLAVLPMSSSLATALAALSNAAAGTALLDVQGIQATADTVVDATSGSSTATGSIAHVAVAGLTVVDSGAVDKSTLTGHTCPNFNVSSLPDALPVGVPVTICLATPAGDLTVVITAGKQQSTYSTATHRNVSLALAEVRLIDGDAAGNNGVSAMGMSSGGGTIATVDAGSVASDVQAASASSNGLVPTSQGGNVVLEKTGMFGAPSLLAGLALLGAGVVLRRRTSRRGKRAS